MRAGGEWREELKLWTSDRKKGFDCESGMSVTNPVTPTTDLVTVDTNNTNMQKHCKRCKQHGHSRVTNKSCEHHTPKGSNQPTRSNETEGIPIVDYCDDAFQATDFSQLSQLTVEGKTTSCVQNGCFNDREFSISKENFDSKCFVHRTDLRALRAETDGTYLGREPATRNFKIFSCQLTRQCDSKIPTPEKSGDAEFLAFEQSQFDTLGGES